MSRISFNHVFIGLLGVSGVFAFVLPPGWSGVVRGRVDFLFTPVSYPVRKVAAAVTGQIVSDTFSPHQTDADAQGEIQRLRAQVVNLATQLEEVRQLKNVREMAGVVGENSRAFRVIGGDVSGADGLNIESGGEENLVVGMPVVFRDALVGKLASAGGSGSRVRLITDRGFSVVGRIFYYDQKAQKLVERSTPPLLVEGQGGGSMQVINLKRKEADAAQVQAGDWVQLRDNDWPSEVQGTVIGEIERVENYARGPGFARLLVRPRISLPQLTDVLVVVGKKQGNSGAVASASKKTNVRK